MVPVRQPHVRLRTVLRTIVLLLSSSTAFAQSAPCESWVARLISFQGELSVRRAESMPASATLNETFCVGDVLEVGPYSRAALQLPDQTVVRVDQGTVITFEAPEDEKRTWLNILKGVIHVISRDPRALRVITPFANAGIEGTEFLVQVSSDSATVLVFEGRVKVENRVGAATADSGESVLAKAGRAPVLQQVVRPRDQVVWTLYYPPTGTGPLPEADATTAGVPGAGFYVGRAELRLAVGRVAEAEADLAAALKIAPGSAEVLARQSVIALTRNDAETASRLAEQAVTAAPASSSARLAQSYVRQSAGDLAGAIATLEAAAKNEPGNALVRARLAELHLASGDVARSETSARAAVVADPELGLAHTILGFAKLTRVDIAAARASFGEAIRLEPGAPLPRLGLGLAEIRDGDLEAGRAEIETAVILDPSNSLLRSYMGKAYYEEKRDSLAASQLQMAKELDPNDPTPWFYDAIRLQSVNRPVEALEDLRKSTRLNDRRAVYRSGLLLDDDAASRNATVSAIYTELGFENLAVVEGSKALSENFGNSTAHRLLANAYSDLPRYDISRVSEAFQAQVRQPLSAPPMNLLETADRLTVLRNSGPTRSGVSEYNSLFNRDQLSIQTDIVVGSRDTWGDQFVASGLSDRIAFALSQLHYETDGFTDNNAAEKDIYGAFLQFEASPATTLQLDARHSEFSLGYTFLPFDPDQFFPVTIDEEADVVRVNGRHMTSAAADWVWTAAFEDRTRDAIYESEIATTTDAKTTVAEFQRLARIGSMQVIAGAGYIDKDEDFPIEGEGIDTYDANAYVYGQWQASRLGITAGLAYDRFRSKFTAFDDDIDRSQLSPKLGVVWSPVDGTTLRGATLVSVRRPFVASQTLEPTQVSGFNQYFTGLEQFYGDPEGTVSRRIVGAVDQEFSEYIFGGIEGGARRLEVPTLQAAGADRSWREKSARAYVYRLMGNVPGAEWVGGLTASISLSAEFENLSRSDRLPGPEGIRDVDTYRLPLTLSLFAHDGMTVRFTTSYVDQKGAFQADSTLPVFQLSDDALITDVLIQYRLPRRIGLLSLGVRNLTDEDLDLMDTDPLNPRVATRRLITGTVSFTF